MRLLVAWARGLLITQGMSSLILAILLATLPMESVPSGTAQAAPPINASVNRSGVITATGGFTTSDADTRLRNVQLVRTYNSNDDRASALGTGWTHNFAMRVVDPGDGSGDVVVVGPAGRSDRYRRSADGSFVSPPGVSADLRPNSDGSFDLIQLDQSRSHFDADGHLMTLMFRSGDDFQLSYDESNNVSRVDTSYGQAFVFLYDDAGRLIEVDLALGDGQVTTGAAYSYDDSGRLISATRASESTMRYTYVADSSKLASVINPNGDTVVDNIYDDRGRVVSQRDAIGVETTYAYSPTPTGAMVVLTTGPTTSADPTWHVQTEETFDEHGWLMQRVEKPTPNSAEWPRERIAYDSNGFPRTITRP